MLINRIKLEKRNKIVRRETFMLITTFFSSKRAVRNEMQKKFQFLIKDRRELKKRRGKNAKFNKPTKKIINNW